MTVGFRTFAWRNLEQEHDRRSWLIRVVVAMEGQPEEKFANEWATAAFYGIFVRLGYRVGTSEFTVSFLCEVLHPLVSFECFAHV